MGGEVTAWRERGRHGGRGDGRVGMEKVWREG